MNTNPDSAINTDLKYDTSITICMFDNRKSGKGKHKTLSIQQLIEDFSQPSVGFETFAEYQALPKAKKDEAKDNGSFIAAQIKSGLRKKENIANRTMLTLDADNAPKDFIERVKKHCPFNWFAYTTRSHSPVNPRWRLVIPFDTPIKVEQYQPLGRWIANTIGMDYFDPTTFEINRIMYLPSVSKDGEYLFEHNDLPFVDVEATLDNYFDWQDVSLWPTHVQEKKLVSATIKKLGNPTEKDGVVGAWCRTYSILDVFAMMPEQYRIEETTGGNQRVSYVHGTSSNGIVIYDDENGNFAYSHHATDPIAGQTVNAYDLYRLAMFGDLDADAKFDTPLSKLPSSKAMQTFAQKDQSVAAELHRFQQQQTMDAFASIETATMQAQTIEDEEEKAKAETLWYSMLERDGNDKLTNTRNNAVHILTYDKTVAAKPRFNLLSQVQEAHLGDGRIEPWQDHHSISATTKICLQYQCNISKQYVHETLMNIAQDDKYHPVQDFLQTLEWDGVPRAETMFIDHLGVKDDIYARETALSFLYGSIERVFNAGAKFDYMPILVGGQGIGKTEFVKMLSNGWHSSIEDLDMKQAFEQTAGAWIVEMSEMSATKKHDIELLKKFITDTKVTFRKAYAQNQSEILRTFTLIGTSNDLSLNDNTGNRRFLPLHCTKRLDFQEFEEAVPQIWAEAFTYWKEKGRKFFVLSREAQAIAEEHQENASEPDVWEETIYVWLRQEAPVNRYTDNSEFDEGGYEYRDRVSFEEIYVDCLKGRMKDIKPIERKRINNIMKGFDGVSDKKTVRFGKTNKQGWTIDKDVFYDGLIDPEF